MWNAYAKWDRLKAALVMRDIDPCSIDLNKLGRVLVSRGITDGMLNNVVWTLISVLEPPSCPMTHCKFYGNSPASMNCGDGKTPGRCKILKDYRQRKKEREQGEEQARAEEQL